MTTVEVLTREDCLALLRTASVGRLAVTVDDGAPLVVPVNYVLDGDVIVFRTAQGSKLDALHRRAVSFEVDFIDPFRRTGWSVLVQGHAHDALHWEVDHISVDSWAGDVPFCVRIEPESITGRRLPPDEFVSDGRGYL